MSFFDVPAPPPEPEREVEHVRPPWHGPPRGVLPGYSQQRATIFRNDQVILFVDRLLVYPTGVKFSFNLIMREANEDQHDMPWELHGRGRRPDPLPDDFLRFGILFGDGSKWTNLDWQMPRPEKGVPDGPVVMGRGGGGGGDFWEMDYWLWPLPPDGPVTFVASWPVYEVSESTAVIDGTELRSCAEAAEVIWPT